MVGGQLHDEGGRVSGEAPGLFQHDAADHNGRHADEIGAGGHPGGAAEDRPGNHGDERHLRAAGDEGGGHDRHAPVAFVLNGPRGHDAGHATAHADQHRDKGFTGEAKLAEHAVQHKGDARHVAAGLQKGQQQEQHQHLGDKAQHRADAGHDAVQDQPLQPLRHAHGVQSALHQRRDARDPCAIVGRVRRALIGLVALPGAQILRGRGL